MRSRDNNDIATTHSLAWVNCTLCSDIFIETSKYGLCSLLVKIVNENLNAVNSSIISQRPVMNA